MIEEIIASRYAKALLYTAAERTTIEKIDCQLDWFLDIVNEHPQLNAILNHPSVKEADKKALLDNVFKLRNFSPELKSFIRLLVEKKRFNLLNHIVEIFDDAVLFLEKRLNVSVESATFLSSEDKKSLTKELSKKFGKAINLTTDVNPDLIAGLKLKVGYKIYDYSLKKNLENLAYQLA